MPKFELERLDDDFYGYRYEVHADNTSGGAVSPARTPPSCTAR